MQSKNDSYKIIVNSNKIVMKDYIENYFNQKKFNELCKKCDKYGALWSCPPYYFDVDKYINKYKEAYIIGTKIVLSDEIIQNTKKDDILDCTYKILNEVRKELGEMLLALEEKYPNSVCLYPGSCLLCNNCERINGKPCIQPDKMRYSLESLGFDVAKTASDLLGIELKWAKDKLPEYFTLVSAFFTNDVVDDILGDENNVQ